MKKARDEGESQVISDIKKYGVHIVQVMEDEEHPRFAYTIGLFENYLHPEVIIIGLKDELTEILLNNIAYDVKNGKTYTANEFHEGVLDDFLCYFGEVPKSEYKDYVGWAIWFYKGDAFPLVQCVYPTVTGIFPWEKNFPEDTKFLAKMITEMPKEH